MDCHFLWQYRCFGGRAMKKLAAVIAAIALIGTPAFAADIARKMPVKAPPPPLAPVINWTGFYIGGNLGGVVEHASGTSDFLDSLGVPGIFSPSNPQNNGFRDARFLGGVQAGYNWQFDPRWLIGIEGDWDWTNTGYSFCRQTNTISLPCFDNGFGFETISSKTDWLATLRGRLGVTWGNWLFYGTGGAAWGRVNTALSLSCLVLGCGASKTPLFASSTTSTTKAGWVAGLGAEWMLAQNWSVRAEWLHIDLGSINDTLPTVVSGGFIQTAVWSRTERFDEFRVGANYLFH
jgi:outer membrane immunogenic protein